MNIIYLNEEFKKYEEALIHIEDRGMEFADGVYEVILFKSNKLIDSKNHIQRLFRSLDALDIKINLTLEEIEEIIIKLFAKNNQKDG